MNIGFRRRLVRGAAVVIIFAVFAVAMWLWRSGAEWLVHSGYGLLVFPIGGAVIAFGWYAERKGWLT